jgi:Uma2 family endonuclease
MAIATQMTVEEYLRTSFDPDCEYVDGEVLDRNVGEKGHSKIQWRLMAWITSHAKEWNVFCLQEWRFHLADRNYRIPDVVVVAGPEPDEEVLETRPLLCIEILSPEDRMSKMQKKVADYLANGVRYVWILDPKSKKATVYTEAESYEVTQGMLRTENPTIQIPLSEIFSE